MKKTLLKFAAAAAIGTAGLSTAPAPADAAAWWVAPVIVGAAIGGTALVATTAANAQAGYYAEAPGTVYVRPTTAPARCYWARERVRGGWRRVQVCD
jgi:hypothetical protein